MYFNKLIQQSLIWRGFYLVVVLAVNICLSRYFKAELTGSIYFATNVLSLVVLLFGFNLESGLTFYGASASIPHNQLASLALLWTFVVAVLLFPLLYITVNTPSYGLFIRQINGISNAMYFVIGLLLCNYFSVIFYAKQNFFIPNVVLGGLNLLLIVVLLVVHRFYGISPKLIDCYFLFFLLQGIALVLVFFFTNKKYGWLVLPSLPLIRQLLRYSAMAMVANVVFFFVYKIDYWFVQYYCSPSDLGNYIQASKMGQLLLVIPQIIASAVFPQTASGKQLAEVGNSILILFRVMLQFFVIIMLGTALLGSWLFPFVFGSTFNHMQLAMLLLLPGIFSLAVLSLVSAYLLGKGAMKMEVMGAIIGLVVVVVGDVLLIPTYGISGAAFVSTLGYGANFLYALYCFRKLHEFSVAHLFKFSFTDWYFVLRLVQKK